MTIDGYSDSRFREVFQAFLTNFEQGAEIGTAVAVYYKGKPVVDLAAGLKDRNSGQPYTRHFAAGLLSNQGNNGPRASTRA